MMQHNASRSILLSSSTSTPRRSASCGAALSLLAFVLPGCLADENAGEESVVAGPSESAELELTARPVPITIQLDDPPYLVLFREGTQGAWRPARQLKDTTYEARVRGPYTVMAVCSNGLEAFTSFTSQTPRDPRLVEVECTSFDEPTVELEVSMVQPGLIALGNALAVSRTADWLGWLSVVPGVRDLVASDNERLLLQRGLEVAEGLMLPQIDLTGAPEMAEVDFRVTNAPLEGVLSVATFLSTAGVAQPAIYRGALPARVAPNELLTAADQQLVSVRSTVSTDTATIMHIARRNNFRVGDRTATPFVNPLESYQLQVDGNADVQAAWTPSGRLDAIEVYAYDEAGRFVDHVASSAYLRATGLASLSLETDLPGYEPAWGIDTAGFYAATFFAAREGALVHGLQHSEAFNLDARPASLAAGRTVGRGEPHPRARLRR